MAEDTEQAQQEAKPYIKLVVEGAGQIAVDSNIPNWQWTLLQIAAELKKNI